MMMRSYLIAIACAAMLATLACGEKARVVDVDTARLSVFKPLPVVMESAGNPLTEEKIKLGRMLYYEQRLSAGQDISCNTCHLLDKYGIDDDGAVSKGHKGQKGNRNAPTVYNAAGHFVQFWDGRAPNIEEQAKGPVLNPVEMAMPNEAGAVAFLKSMPEYVDLFKKAFPDAKDPVTYDNMAKAIGAFERKLVTTSRWDKFLAGDQSALTMDEKAGLMEFLDAGCQTCHNGMYLGGSMFQKLGAVKPWGSEQDLGRFAVTKQDPDKMVFKVPSLRNIEKTGPFYHDGTVVTIEDAITKMGVHQLGMTLTPEQVKSIVTFLKTLTGELPAEYIKQPELPKSTAKTPKPKAV
jgi:cytochrome c peroxidase